MCGGCWQRNIWQSHLLWYTEQILLKPYAHLSWSGLALIKRKSFQLVIWPFGHILENEITHFWQWCLSRSETTERILSKLDFGYSPRFPTASGVHNRKGVEFVLQRKFIKNYHYIGFSIRTISTTSPWKPVLRKANHSTNATSVEWLAFLSNVHRGYCLNLIQRGVPGSYSS